MIKVKVFLVVLISVIVVLLGALYQAYILMEKTPNVEVQVIKRSAEILKGAAPAFVYGKFAEMVDSSSNAVYAGDSLDAIKNMIIYERKPSGEELKTLINNLKLDSRAECFVIVDGKGKVIMRSNEDRSGDVIIGLPIVKRALSGSISGDTMEMKSRPMFVAGIPVADDNGAVIGAVVFGFPFDSKTMLDIWDQQINAHMTFIWKNQIVASSFAPLDKVVREGISKRKYLRGFVKTPPEGEIVSLGSGRRVVVFGVPGNLKGQGGFVASPRELSEFAGINIFTTSQWLFAAAGLAILIALLGAFWAVKSFSHDVALLVERVKKAGDEKDPSIIQPQAFNKEIAPVAKSVREAMAAIIAHADKKRSTNSALEIPEELRDLSDQSAIKAGSAGPEVAPPPQKEVSDSTVAKFAELIDSTLAGNATTPPPKVESQQPESTPEPPKEEPVSAPAMDEPGSELQKLVEEMNKEIASKGAALQPETNGQPQQPPVQQQQAAKPAPAQQPKPVTSAPQQQSAEEMVKVTLHGGPGGIPVVKPEDLEMSEQDKLKAQFEKVFAEYVALRKQLGEPVDKLSKEKFFANLTQNRQRIMQKFQCRDVKFTVFNKNGKASVKATPIK